VPPSQPVLRFGGVHAGRGRSILVSPMPSTPSFKVQLAATRKPRPKDSDLVFGRTFTDHMAIVDWESERGWFDPRVVPYGPFSLDPAAAVFHYAQEMFDGLKAFRGADGKVRFFRLDRHCKRMHDGGERLCIPAIDEDLMREAILSLVRVDADWVPSSAGTSLYIGGYGEKVFTPARILIEDKYVRAAAGGLGGVKAGANYIASLRAAEDAKARGYAQVLWTDAVEHTNLEEVGTMNLVVRIGDEFVTPPLGGSILAGVTRDSVLTLLRAWGFAAHERPIGMEELIGAHRAGKLREVFGCGTAAVITPVGALGWKGEDMVINNGEPGEISARLFDTITGVQSGREPDTHGWMTTLD
jgi:branched-chain amino acid aminotransferase